MIRKILIVSGVFAILLFSVGTTNAIKCYYCVHCNDPFDANGQEVVSNDCNGRCSKVTIGDWVTRACLPFLKNDGCEENDIGEVCSCTTDLCNSSNSLTVSFMLIGLLTAFGSLYIQ